MKGLMVVGLFFFGAGLFLSIILPFFVPALRKILWIWVPVIIGYCFFLKIFINAWRERNHYITVSEKGIAANSLDSQKKFIQWENISKIRENNIFERLIITDKYDKQIKVEYELENLSRFLDILIKNISHLTKKYSSATTFHRTARLHTFNTIVSLFMLSLAISGYISGLYVQALAMAGFFAYMVYLSLVAFIRIDITGETINIIFPLGKKTLYFSRIKKVTLENIRVGNGKAAQYVLLKLNDGKTIKLNDVKEGTIALYSAVRKKLENFS